MFFIKHSNNLPFENKFAKNLAHPLFQNLTMSEVYIGLLEVPETAHSWEFFMKESIDVILRNLTKSQKI